MAVAGKYKTAWRIMFLTQNKKIKTQAIWWGKGVGTVALLDRTFHEIDRIKGNYGGTFCHWRIQGSARKAHAPLKWESAYSRCIVRGWLHAMAAESWAPSPPPQIEPWIRRCFLAPTDGFICFMTLAGVRRHTWWPQKVRQKVVRENGRWKP